MTINKNYNGNGCLEKDLTIEEFKKLFDVSDDEYIEAEKQASSNVYGTQDLKFIDEEDELITIEVNSENKITHIYY